LTDIDATPTTLGQPPADVTTPQRRPVTDVPKPHPDDQQFISVTTIIGVLNKEGLKYWAAEQAAEAAIDSQKTWQAMLEEHGRPVAVKWIRDAFTPKRLPRYKLASTALGTVTHKVCEEYALTGKKPDRDFAADLIRATGRDQPDLDIDAETTVVGQMLNQFDTWLQRFTPTAEAAEMTVYSPTFGYAGTLDAILTIDGTRFITDYKTSREPFDSYGKPRAPYPEQVAVQLAAYRWAELAVIAPRRTEIKFRRYYLLNQTEQDNAVVIAANPTFQAIDTGLCIHITPEHCMAYPVRCDTDVHTSFLYLLEAFRWVDDLSKTVMGAPLQ
jgi:hypothetical protein